MEELWISTEIEVRLAHFNALQLSFKAESAFTKETPPYWRRKPTQTDMSSSLEDQDGENRKSIKRRI